MSRALIPVTLLVALVGLLAFTGPTAVRAQDASPATDETGAIAQRFVEAMNTIFATGDTAALDELVAPDYVNHTPSPTREGGVSAPDLAGLKESFAAVHAVFPGATVTVEDTIVEGDLAALVVTFNGMGGPDTESDGAVIVRVADGRIVESWNFEEGGTQRMQPMFEATPAA